MQEEYGSIETEDMSSDASTIEEARVLLTVTTGKKDGIAIGNNENDGGGGDGKASLLQTVLNIIKMYFGTGVLALPFATSEAGLLWHPLGLLLICLWTVYSTDCLLRSHNYMIQYNEIEAAENETENENGIRNNTRRTVESLLTENSSLTSESVHNNEQVERDERKTDTFGKLAYFALGEFGLNLTDALLLSLTAGVTICYEDAIVGFLEATPLSTGNKYLDTCGVLLIIIPLASMSDFSMISKVSALGTFLIFFVFALIGIYGIYENGYEGFTKIHEQRIWPDHVSGLSSWYGVVAFSFGAIPFTFNMKESMKKPAGIMRATKISLWFVFISYVLIGELMLVIFWPTIHGIKSDITRVLPMNTYLSSFVSLSMAMVILCTTPLVIVPCGALVMKKLGLDRLDGEGQERRLGVTVRIIICIICALISVMVPNFVYVVSFIGCLCMSILSFAYPPLTHMLCLMKLNKKTLRPKRYYSRMVIDVVVFVFGLTSSILTTYMTFQTMVERIRSS